MTHAHSIRFKLTLVSFALMLLAVAGTAAAHHGWRWTENGNVEVTGVIASATLGNPHGVLVLDVEGDQWVAEVGQPWRNERAGLTDEMFAVGTEIIIDGQRSANAEELKVKAERIIIDGKAYLLYPERL